MRLIGFLCIVITGQLLTACAAKRLNTEELDRLDLRCEDTLDRIRAEDRVFRLYENDAYGAAVFPTVGKGGIIYVGGSSGSGLVYERGEPIGSTRMTQATLGLQLGGQAFSQVILFEDEASLRSFTAGEFEFGAQASAVAADIGAAAGVQFENGMATFILAKGGLMYEASIGGQKFAFEPLDR